jgi:hypothetical protein
MASSWALDDWRRFATEHLRLTPATLNEAIDPVFQLARQRTEEYLTRLEGALSKGLGPLLVHIEGEACGESVIEELLGESNYALLGGSGLGKSFHLQHLALRALNQGEVPVLVEARYLDGDFTVALRRAIGPFTKSEPGVLLDSIRKCGLRPLLIIDGINGREPFVPDLLKDILAFQVQHQARVIIGSQEEFDRPGGLTTNSVTLAPLRPEHKRTIYRFHAQLTNPTDLDPFCEAFGTAFDLMIAGSIHARASTSLTRAELYDRYCQRMLPPGHTAVAAYVLRDLARRMTLDFVSSIPLHEFERRTEALLIERREPLQVIDELRCCRLLTISEETVSLQHDLLRDYFFAEELSRSCVDSTELSQKLSKARESRADRIYPT